MNCEEARDSVHERLDGAGDAASAARLGDHLARCVACAAFERELRSTLAVVRDLPEEDPPSELRARVLASVRGEGRFGAPGPRSGFAGAPVRRLRPLGLRMAAAAAAILVGGFFALQAIGPEPIEGAGAEVAQAPSRGRGFAEGERVEEGRKLGDRLASVGSETEPIGGRYDAPAAATPEGVLGLTGSADALGAAPVAYWVQAADAGAVEACAAVAERFGGIEIEVRRSEEIARRSLGKSLAAEADERDATTRPAEQAGDFRFEWGGVAGFVPPVQTWAIQLAASDLATFDASIRGCSGLTVQAVQALAPPAASYSGFPTPPTGGTGAASSFGAAERAFRASRARGVAVPVGEAPPPPAAPSPAPREEAAAAKEAKDDAKPASRPASPAAGGKPFQVLLHLVPTQGGR